MPADGAALVVLTTRQVARAYAVVEGVATNNDGARKGGFSQPSEAAQVAVRVRLWLRVRYPYPYISYPES